MRIRNVILVIKDQMPMKRLINNFFSSRNAWGLFHINSHVSQRNGKLKVQYNSKASAIKAADSMGRKYGGHYSNYKCLYCDGFHVGKNRDNK